MKSPDFTDVARLWKEQIDPAEHASLEALARDIEQTAKRRRLLDFPVGFAALAGMIYLTMQPAPLPIRLGFALTGLFLIWLTWKRHRLLTAAEALVLCEPSRFFAAAIENARDELRFFSINLLGCVPLTLFVLLLATTDLDAKRTDIRVVEVFEAHPIRGAIWAAFMAGILIIGVRSRRKRREQVDRLEQLRDEFEDDLRD